MHSSCRFAVAVHTLALVAVRTSEHPVITSHTIAESVNTNPVVIRRILGLLREARLVESQSGSGGGWTLKRQPEAITLLEVYRAVESAPLFVLHHQPPNRECEIGKNIQEILNSYFGQAQKAMEEKLEQVTVAEILIEIGARAQGTRMQDCAEDVKTGTKQPVRAM